MMNLIVDAVGTMVVGGAFSYGMGFAKSFMDRHPEYKELGWNGALLFPVVAAFSFFRTAAKAGYVSAEQIPVNWDPANALPPPTANALNPGKED